MQRDPYAEHERAINDGEGVDLPGRRGPWKAVFWIVGISLFVAAIYVAQQGAWTLPENSPADDGSLVATSGVDTAKVAREGTEELRYRSADSADHVVAPDAGANDNPTLADPGVLSQLDRPRQLIGKQVTVRNVNVARRANEVAFWVGEGERQLLVVLHRDTRTLGEHQDGEPPAYGFGSSDATHPGVTSSTPVTITGTIQPVPYDEFMYSWGLTVPERHRLKASGVYLRAERITR